MTNFTDEDIKQMVPEARKFDEGWFLVGDGKLMPFTNALNLLLTTRKELKEARELLAVVADDALEYALEARNAVIDDNRPRYQRQRDAIDADLAKFRAIIDTQPNPQAPSVEVGK